MWLDLPLQVQDSWPCDTEHKQQNCTSEYKFTNHKDHYSADEDEISPLSAQNISNIHKHSNANSMCITPCHLGGEEESITLFSYIRVCDAGTGLYDIA